MSETVKINQQNCKTAKLQENVSEVVKDIKHNRQTMVTVTVINTVVTMTLAAGQDKYHDVCHVTLVNPYNYRYENIWRKNSCGYFWPMSR